MENIERNNNRSIPHRKNNKYKSPYLLSIVIPLFNEEESLRPLAELIEKELDQYMHEQWEVIFIDDGSTDHSYKIIKELHFKNKNFKCISFRRNYGKSAALAVGFSHAKGRYIGTMDADLQDDPKEFKNMFSKMNEGYDLVSGWKQVRHDPFVTKVIPSKFFNYMTSLVAGVKLHDFNCGIKLYKREVVESLQVYGEMHRYLPAFASIEGFKVTEVPVEHHKRQYGKSKFGMARFVRGFLDLLTVLFTTRYLKRPMHFFGLWGTVSSAIGTVVCIVLCVEWFRGETALSNRPLAWFSLSLIIIGIQLFSIGFIAELLVKQAYNKSKNYNVKYKLM